MSYVDGLATHAIAPIEKEKRWIMSTVECKKDVKCWMVERLKWYVITSRNLMSLMADGEHLNE